MNEEQKKNVDNAAYEALKEVARKQKMPFHQLPDWVTNLMIASFQAGIEVFVKEIEKGEGLRMVLPGEEPGGIPMYIKK